ncbi:MAG: HAD family hydrolase [Thermodesulfobacteriota bacterium]
MKAVFLDFDGVIVDSIRECYEVSLLTYWGFRPPPGPEDQYRGLFRAARGLVGPAREYLFLHEAVRACLGDPDEDLAQAFAKARGRFSPGEVERFEAIFFACRAFVSRDRQRWLALHSLTDFGRSLVGRELPHHYIITTKDEDSVRLLLSHFEIAIDTILGRDDFTRSGDKAAMIGRIMDERGYSEARFVDDNQTHLGSVSDPRIRLVFADWGYGSLLGQDINRQGAA